MNNIDLFCTLAQQSEHALLALVLSQAEKKDFSSLKDFVQAMDLMGSQCNLFERSKIARVHYKSSEQGYGRDMVDDHASFPRALMRAISPLDFNDEGNLKGPDQRFSEFANEDEIDLLNKSIQLKTMYQNSGGFTSAAYRSNFFSSMLFNAAGMTPDARIFDALVVTGASLERRHLSHCESFEGKMVLPVLEAFNHGNLPGALAILKHMDPDKVSETMLGFTEGSRSPDQSQASAFKNMKVVKFMTDALKSDRQEDSEVVAQILDVVCQKCESLSKKNMRSRSVGGELRALMACAYLSESFGSGLDWHQKSIDAILGHSDNPVSTVQGCADRWDLYTKEGARHEERWSLIHKKDKKPCELNQRYLMSELAFHAVQSNCVDVLNQISPLLEKTPGAIVPDFGTALKRGQSIDPLMSLLRFRQTIEVLALKGHGVHDNNPFNAGGGSCLHALASLPEPSVAVCMPFLLGLGANLNLTDGQSTPRETITDDETKKTWDNIHRSFEARSIAHGVLHELENSECESPTKTKSMTP